MAGRLYEIAEFNYEINMKNKDTFKGIVKYLRELSVVVVGIAITFSVNNWISYKNEQKDLKRYLELVKMELEDNLGVVQQQFEFYDQTGKLAKYLFSSGKQENLQADSLDKYVEVMRDLKYMSYKTSAFEMLKSSGTMRLIKDKDFLKSILDSYSQMEYAKMMGDRELEMKNKEGRNAVMENGLDDIFKLWKPEYKRLFHYFAIYTGCEGNFRTCKQQIEKTLQMF